MGAGFGLEIYFDLYDVFELFQILGFEGFDRFYLYGGLDYYKKQSFSFKENLIF